jgi:hypothetical protein
MHLRLSLLSTTYNGCRPQDRRRVAAATMPETRSKSPPEIGAGQYGVPWHGVGTAAVRVIVGSHADRT